MKAGRVRRDVSDLRWRFWRGRGGVEGEVEVEVEVEVLRGRGRGRWIKGVGEKEGREVWKARMM